MLLFKTDHNIRFYLSTRAALALYFGKLTKCSNCLNLYLCYLASVLLVSTLAELARVSSNWSTPVSAYLLLVLGLSCLPFPANCFSRHNLIHTVPSPTWRVKVTLDTGSYNGDMLFCSLALAGSVRRGGRAITYGRGWFVANLDCRWFTILRWKTAPVWSHSNEAVSIVSMATARGLTVFFSTKSRQQRRKHWAARSRTQIKHQQKQGRMWTRTADVLVRDNCWSHSELLI